MLISVHMSAHSALYLPATSGEGQGRRMDADA